MIAFLLGTLYGWVGACVYYDDHLNGRRPLGRPHPRFWRRLGYALIWPGTLLWMLGGIFFCLIDAVLDRDGMNG